VKYDFLIATKLLESGLKRCVIDLTRRCHPSITINETESLQTADPLPVVPIISAALFSCPRSADAEVRRGEMMRNPYESPRIVDGLRILSAPASGMYFTLGGHGFE
jgi:hypothetical protein